jgi:hypothetical protein
LTGAETTDPDESLNRCAIGSEPVVFLGVPGKLLLSVTACDRKEELLGGDERLPGHLNPSQNVTRRL